MIQKEEVVVLDQQEIKLYNYMKKHNTTRRRLTALEGLEKQLKSGKKPEKIKGKTTDNMVDLTDSDKKRIKEQITILKERTV